MHLTTAREQNTEKRGSFKTIDNRKIYVDFVSGRIDFLLDNNVWIELADQRSEMARECLLLAREAVVARKMIFPVCFPSVSELLSQGEQGRGQAMIMDELSLGVAYRALHEIKKLEALNACSFLIEQSPHVDVHRESFTLVADYLADSSIEYPASMSQSALEQGMDDIRALPELRSMVWMIENLPIEAIVGNHRRGEHQWIQHAEDMIYQNLLVKLNREQLERQIAEQTLLEELAPLMVEVGLAHYGVDRFRELMETVGTNKYYPRSNMIALLEHFPSTHVTVEVLAASILDSKRPVRPQDLWDSALAYHAAYTKGIVTTDRHLADMLAKKGSVLSSKGIPVFPLREFRTFLEQVVSIRL